MRRFVGCIIEESLTDSFFVEGLPVMAERASHMPNDPDATVWHVRWYRVAEGLLLALLPRLAETIRPHWYAHFWAGDDLRVVMPGRVFWAKIADRASHAEFIAYGDTVGIERKWSEQIPTALPAWASQNDDPRMQ